MKKEHEVDKAYTDWTKKLSALPQKKMPQNEVGDFATNSLASVISWHGGRGSDAGFQQRETSSESFPDAIGLAV
jgi:hypothetical protein